MLNLWAPGCSGARPAAAERGTHVSGLAAGAAAEQGSSAVASRSCMQHPVDMQHDCTHHALSHGLLCAGATDYYDGGCAKQTCCIAANATIVVCTLVQRIRAQPNPENLF